jgi:phage N-6-adenine-methyltransferase
MTITKGLFTSLTPEYSTPEWLYQRLHNEFHFTLDPCATIENYKCKRYFTKTDDGLKQKWSGRVFMNPPYGREIYFWIKKAYESVVNNDCQLVVCLIPSRTDTKWWHEYCMKSKDIRFIKGRVRFRNNKPAPFPSCIVVFSKETLVK